MEHTFKLVAFLLPPCLSQFIIFICLQSRRTTVAINFESTYKKWFTFSSKAFHLDPRLMNMFM